MILPRIGPYQALGELRRGEMEVIHRVHNRNIGRYLSLHPRVV